MLSPSTSLTGLFTMSIEENIVTLYSHINNKLLQLLFFTIQLLITIN